MDENIGVRLKIQIVKSQPDQFGDTQSSGKAEVNHGAIPDAISFGWIRRIHDGLHLFNREVPDYAYIGFFSGIANIFDRPSLLMS